MSVVTVAVVVDAAVAPRSQAAPFKFNQNKNETKKKTLKRADAAELSAAADFIALLVYVDSIGRQKRALQPKRDSTEHDYDDGDEDVKCQPTQKFLDETEKRAEFLHADHENLFK